MSHILDSSGGWGGVIPFRHEHYDKPEDGKPWELAQRCSILGARVRGQKEDEDAPGSGGPWIVGMDDRGDMTGAVIWMENDGKRGRHPIAWGGFAALVNDDKGPSFGSGSTSTRVVFKLDEEDERLKSCRMDLWDGWPELPPGIVGYVVAAQDESTQRELFLHTDPRIVAPRRGGKVKHGTPVVDVGEGKLDPVGLFQDLVIIADADGAYQPALCMTKSPKGNGGGYGCSWGLGDGGAQATSGGYVTGWLDNDRGGPLYAGHATNDKHKVGTNRDGESVQPWHIRIGPLGAYYYKNRIEDGRLDHTAYTPGGFRGQPRQARFGYDFATGLHRWWHRADIIDPPPPDIPFEPINDRIPPYFPHPEPEPLPPGSPTEPVTGRPLQPGLYEQELAAPSFKLTGARDRDSQPGDGRYGGPGQDTVFPDGPEIDLSGLDDLTGSSGLAPDGARFDLPPRVDPDTVDPDELSNELRGRRRRREEHERTTGRSGGLSAAALRRGGPAPLTLEMVGLPACEADGRWQYKSKPSERWGNGTSQAAAAVIAPGGWLSDGPGDQSEWIGELTLLLYPGTQGGSATKFGWADWSQRGAAWSDGVVFQPIGSSGSRDLELRFRDAAGTPRAGTVYIGGGFSDPANLHVYGKLTVDGLIDPTGLKLTPQASSPATDCLWIKTGTPTQLWFTDSDGLDTQIV